MKIIQPSVELIDDINPDDILAKIERCGRVSHQSESKGNPEDFIRKIIKLGHESVLEHVSLTFHIICDRAIMSELTRHRHASFNVESTRYVKYDKFEVIVLPLCLKSELYMTANLRELRHIVKLRTGKAAHPQMRFIAGQILAILRDKLPVIVEDIREAT